MSQDGSWRRSTWTPPKPFKSSVMSKQAGRWESTGAPFNSPTRPARLPNWHLRRLSQRQLSHLIAFLPLNPEEFTILGESARVFHSMLPGSAMASLSPEMRRRAFRVSTPNIQGKCSLQADAAQSSVCAYMSWIALAGLMLNSFAHIPWADPVAALALLPVVLMEAKDSLRGDSCCPP